MRVAQLAGLLAVSGLTLAAGHAFAQAAAPAPQPTPAATPGVAGTGSTPAAAPAHFDLTPTQAQWTKVCSPDPTAGNKQSCLTYRDFSQSQGPSMSMAVYATDGLEKHTARFLLPNAMLLKPGFTVVLDKNDPIAGHYLICLPANCFGEIEFGEPTMTLLKKTQSLSVVMRNQGNAEVTLTAPIKDFGPAYDGPSIDPKALQAMQEERQRQLAEEARKQRELLVQQSQQGLQPPPGPIAGGPGAAAK